MASIFDQLEQQILQSLTQNVYTDSNQYLQTVNSNKSPIDLTSAKVQVQTDYKPQGQNDAKALTVPFPRDPSNTSQNTLNRLAHSNPPKEGDVRARGSNAFGGGNIYDDRASNPFKGIGQFSLNAPYSLGSVDIFAISNWVRNVAKELFGGVDFSSVGSAATSLASSKGVQFVASKFLLTSLNPGDPEVGGNLNRVWNPLSIVLSNVPFVRTFPLAVGPTIASVVSDYSTNVGATVAADVERLTLMRRGLYVPSPGPYDFLRLELPKPGFFGDPLAGDTLQKPGVPFSTIEGQVDQSGLGVALSQRKDVHKNIYTSNKKYSDGPVAPLAALEKAVRDAEPQYASNPFIQTGPEGAAKVAQQNKLDALFEKPSFPISIGSLTGEASQNYQWYAKGNLTRFIQNENVPTADNVSARIVTPSQDEINGTFRNLIDDNEIYMPFMFQDLRDATNQFLYFRAFLKEGLAETFSPEWNIQRFYGRVDPVPVYMGTTRDVSVSFDVVAWAPADLLVMWKKLHKLQSMVYPSFNTQGYLNTAPIIRMRIGDLFSAYQSPGTGNTNKLGIPGFITSLDFAYDDGIWNLETEYKVPRKVSVTLSFTIIHEGNPGLWNPATYPTTGDSTQVFGTGFKDQDTQNFLGLPSGVRGLQKAVDEYYQRNGLDT